MECKHDIALLMGTKDGIVCGDAGNCSPTMTRSSQIAEKRLQLL